MGKTVGKSIKTLYREQAPQYVVIAVGGSAPTVMHDRRMQAEKEAERLAIDNPDTVFHVAKIKRSIKAGDACPTRSRFTKEIETLEGIEPGDWFMVSPDFYRHANKLGYLTDITETENGDTLFWLQMGDGPPIRFDPHVLLMQETAEPQHDTANDDDELSPGAAIGKILAQIAMGAIFGPRAAITQLVGYGREIALGERVYVIVEMGNVFEPGTIWSGHITSYANDEDFVFVQFDSDDTETPNKPEKVPANAVFRENDPNFVIG